MSSLPDFGGEHAVRRCHLVLRTVRCEGPSHTARTALSVVPGVDTADPLDPSRGAVHDVRSRRHTDDQVDHGTGAARWTGATRNFVRHLVGAIWWQDHSDSPSSIMLKSRTFPSAPCKTLMSSSSAS